MIIVLEGPDGCGKTTQSKALARIYNALRIELPDRGTCTGRLIDRILHGLDDRDGVTLQALMSVNKFEVQQEILEAMARGKNVVLCRWSPSALVYGEADGCDPAWLENIHRFLVAPDLCFLLDLPVEVSLERKGVKAEAYETRERLTKVRAIYLKLWAAMQAKGHGEWIKINADATAPEVESDLRTWIGWWETHRK